jgi:hypothetical protein
VCLYVAARGFWCGARLRLRLYGCTKAPQGSPQSATVWLHEGSSACACMWLPEGSAGLASGYACMAARRLRKARLSLRLCGCTRAPLPADVPLLAPLIHDSTLRLRGCLCLTARGYRPCMPVCMDPLARSARRATGLLGPLRAPRRGGRLPLRRYG